MKLEQRIVLITGGTSGIGLELARQLLERNNKVIVTGRDPRKIGEVAKQHPGLHVLPCDVRWPEDILRLHQIVVGQFPALDVLINNAGIMRNLNLTDAKGIEDVTREIDVLLCGPIRMVQQFMPQLRAQNSYPSFIEPCHATQRGSSARQL